MPSFRALAGRIRQELLALARVARRAEDALAAATASHDDRYVDAVALNLHAYYSGLERLFEAIAREVDGAVPQGPNWHVDLLAQVAAPIAEVRPAAISTDLLASLDRLRGFRHVVRNAYTYNLDAQQIAVLVDELGAIAPKASSELADFADWLDAAAAQ
jgi:hypothetical protein